MFQITATARMVAAATVTTGLIFAAYMTPIGRRSSRQEQGSSRRDSMIEGSSMALDRLLPRGGNVFKVLAIVRPSGCLVCQADVAESVEQATRIGSSLALSVALVGFDSSETVAFAASSGIASGAHWVPCPRGCEEASKLKLPEYRLLFRDSLLLTAVGAHSAPAFWDSVRTRVGSNALPE